MITKQQFVTMSIDINLFFLRIMKEHSLFLELGFMPKDKNMGAQAASFRTGFEQLLSDAIELAKGNVSSNALSSRQIATQFTIEAERLTSFYTGLPIDTELTRRELALQPESSRTPAASLVNAVEDLDRRAYKLTQSLAAFKERLLSDVLACKMFTVNYPLLIDHIMREARFFMNLLAALVSGENIMSPEDLINKEAFWSRIMAEHSKFIAGILDPTEETLIETARMYGKEFDELTARAAGATRQTVNTAQLTAETRRQTIGLRDFKAAGTEGILGCKIRSIIIPLLGDHVLREANHYLCVLGMCGQAQ